MNSGYIYRNSDSLTYKAFGCTWLPTSALSAYSAVLETLANIDMSPTHLAVSTPASSGTYRAFRKERLRSQTLPDSLKRIEMTCADSGYLHPDTWGKLYYIIDVQRQSSGLTWIPQAVSGPADVLETMWKRVIAISHATYSFRQQSQWHPQGCPWSFYFDHAELAETRRDQLTLWLHDIYPHNYLSEPYLDAPVGHTGMSLRQWIEAEPDKRGVLTPYTDTLLDWTPPTERIPAIREELYKMGRVFSNLFLVETTTWAKAMADRHEPNPLYRPDQYAPWEAPANMPIPARFRAETYADLDPAITTWLRFEPGYDSMA